MPRRKKPPLPNFIPWDGSKVITVRHHEDDRRIGRIGYLAQGNSGEGWYLSWEYAELPNSRHEDALAAVAAACDAYPVLLQHEAEELKQYESEDRAVRLQANALARAVRIPMGGQRGWKPASNGDPA